MTSGERDHVRWCITLSLCDPSLFSTRVVSSCLGLERRKSVKSLFMCNPIIKSVTTGLSPTLTLSYSLQIARACCLARESSSERSSLGCESTRRSRSWRLVQFELSREANGEVSWMLQQLPDRLDFIRSGAVVLRRCSLCWSNCQWTQSTQPSVIFNH